MKLMHLIWLAGSIWCVHAMQMPKQTIKVDATRQQQEKMKLLLIALDTSQELGAIVKKVAQDLTCSEQKLSGFNVHWDVLAKIPTKKTIRTFFDQGFSVVIFLSYSGDTVEWRIYDTQNGTMLDGKKVRLQKSAKATAHSVADQIWQVLTGQESVFLTKIAYCTTVKKGKKCLKNIVIQDPCAHDVPVTLVQGGKLLGPRWNKDNNNPSVLYSEVTPANIRLMAAQLDGKRKIISNGDGLTMLANFSPDGQKVAYCASHKNSCQIYLYYIDATSRKGVNRRITFNQGNNTSPNICANGDIIFCSDYETKSPQIYLLSHDTGLIRRITQGGYCASPQICDKTGRVAYSKLIGNDMQIFVYNRTTNEHYQLTFDRGSKDECTWSPCGNYLAYVYKEGQKSRIAVQNMITQERFFLTKEGEECSYPAWSGKYADIGIFA